MSDRFAIIGGSGAYNILKKEGFGADLECRKINTPFGESATIHRFVVGQGFSPAIGKPEGLPYSFLFI
ncbi:MAG: hypothetical protein HY097_05890, partial [Nitrospinae bacterium]|nr:hypothetical protein [Nitrospinota bacterium]